MKFYEEIPPEMGQERLTTHSQQAYDCIKQLMVEPGKWALIKTDSTWKPHFAFTQMEFNRFVQLLKGEAALHNMAHRLETEMRYIPGDESGSWDSPESTRRRTVFNLFARVVTEEEQS